jgi:hypothetical protein
MTEFQQVAALGLEVFLTPREKKQKTGIVREKKHEKNQRDENTGRQSRQFRRGLVSSFRVRAYPFAQTTAAIIEQHHSEHEAPDFMHRRSSKVIRAQNALRRRHYLK